MALPGPLRSDRVARLAADLTAGGASDDGQPNRSTGGSKPALGGPIIRATRGGRELAHRAARRAARPMIERVTASSIALGRQAIQQVEELDNSLDSIRMDVTEWELQRDDLRAGLVNQELLKAEVRAMGGVLEELARAIAPAVGLPGAGIALAELRERLTMCERRVRHLESAPSASQSTSLPPPSSDAGLAPPDPAAPRAPASALFDYAGFERRFRGTPEDVSAMLDERYGELLQGHPPVLDIGCGRAELVALLAGRGVAAIGVDTDPSMVADAREQGLEVVQADALQFLRDQAPGTFGAIVATHILEHLELDPLIELLELSQSRLRPGGIFIAETPNPASLIVLGNAYILDPTHVRPLHPKLLEFLCEASGFRSLEVRFFAPATGFQLDLIADPDAPPWVSQINRALHQLNTVLFGPQDFAIVARSGAADDRDRPGPTAQ